LKQTGKYWEVAGTSKEKPILNEQEVLIKGRKRSENMVEYGIETYFVPEGKAREIERVRSPSKLSAEVMVDRFGNSVINRIFIDDKPVVF
jgi:uncharacterized membrane-anchored protein